MSNNKYLGTNKIFVFSSNRPGRHGKGSAKHALENYGAIYGIGEGLVGNSYAIPTKDGDSFKGGRLWTLPLNEIKKHVDIFTQFAIQHPELEFEVIKIGCGLAGYKTEQIAPMFVSVPDNCILPDEWINFYTITDFHD
jgi:hypothetical protein